MLLPLQQNLRQQIRLSWLEIEPEAAPQIRLSWLEIEPGAAVEPAPTGNPSRGLGIGGPHDAKARALRIQRERAVHARNQEIIQAIVAMVTSGALDEVTTE